VIFKNPSIFFCTEIATSLALLAMTVQFSVNHVIASYLSVIASVSEAIPVPVIASYLFVIAGIIVKNSCYFDPFLK
jgi:hypothetical protein